MDNSGQVSHPMGRSEETRIRRWLLHIGAAWTAATILYCAWWQQAEAAFWITAAIVAVTLLLDYGPRLGQTVGRTLQFILLASWIAGFYRLRGITDVSAWRHWLLTLLVFGSLYYLLLCALAWLQSPRERVSNVVLAAGLVFIAALSADLFFVGRVSLQPLRPPAYHPYLAYSIRDSYAYAHAREQRVKDTQGIEFQQQKEAGVTRIVLAGASTMWDRIPRTLENELRDRYPERRFEVLTTSCPGKYQLNELIDATVTIPHWDPDLVISINGFNEIWYGEDENYYEGMPYVEGQMRTAGTASVLFARFSHFGALQFVRGISDFDAHSPYRLQQRRDYEPPRYYSYLRLTARNLASLNIPYVHTFCPNVAEQEHRTPAEDQMLAKGGNWISEVPERRRQSEQIVQEEGQTSYPIMSVLNTVHEQVFRDECHLNERGVHIVCADLAQRIPDWIESWSGLPGAASQDR